MSVRLGTVAPIGFHEFPPAQWLAGMRKLGCTAVQVYRNQLVPISRQQIRDALAAGGMPCDSLHGIFGEQFDPSAPLERARRFAVDTYRAEGELAVALGGSLVVVHCSTIRRQGIGPEERKVRLDQFRKSIQDLAFFGESIGVRYAFENLPSYHPIGSDMAELAAIVGEIPTPSVGICFDTGHANMSGDPVQAVSLAGSRIIYVHLNDNSGQADDHLMPTYGSLDTAGLARALHATGYDGTMMLEVFCNLERLQRFIDEGCAERLRRVLDAANGAAS
jgi:sugar phosphate isomerase/epimerase